MQRRCRAAAEGDGNDHRAPIVIVRTVASRQLVVRACPRTAGAGVAPGMTLAQARALLAGVEHLHVAPHEPQRDRGALVALATWMTRYAPLVAVDEGDEPRGLLLEITGCQRLYGGEARMIETIAAALDQLGIRARLAAAPTFGCAWAVARANGQPRIIVPDGGEREALAGLPVAALRLDETVVEALHDVGVARIDELLALPRREIFARYGGGTLRRIDQALGAAGETIDPVRPVEPPRVRCALNGPTTRLEAITLIVRRLLADLADILARQERGARRLDLDVDRADAAPWRDTVTLSRPSRDVKHLWSIFAPRIEAMDMGFGVEEITITATHTGRLRHEQQCTGAAPENADEHVDGAIAELIDTYTHRLGPARTVAVQLLESHWPERAFAYRPLSEGAGTAPPRITAADRPSVLLSRPEPIDVMALLPEDPPAWLRWRGEEHAVVTALGPERIAREWWADGAGGPDRARDYCRVQTAEGRWLWVFRAVPSGRWFVHGQWS